MGELDGMVTLVTGGAAGIGKATAAAFAAAGAVVVIADLSGDAADAAAGSLGDGRAFGAALDVRDESQVAKVADDVERVHGPIDVWVNNAGITRPAMLHKMEVDDFDLVLDVHVRGTFLGIREAARRMIAAGTRGNIINVTSAAGLQGTIGQVNYSAAKGAIAAMTKSAAKELARHEIRVNAVAPVAATAMTAKIREDERLVDRYLTSIPLGRFADPEETAGAFRFLASPGAAYITGQVLCVDGGLYMAS